MRVTAATREATRRRILDVARARFAAEGFAAVATRDIASEAGIASGTIFNYFRTKEAIATALVAESLASAHARFQKKPRTAGPLEEELFALIATELRSLKPHRNYLRPALETALDPLANPIGDADPARRDHLAIVERLLAADGRKGPQSSEVMYVYWTLYTGVLNFWASDPSPNQEDTLGVLDHALRAFVAMLPPKVTRQARSKS